MNKDALCKAFCADLQITPVPIGFAVKTPFSRPDGDAVGFYIRRDATGELRLEDDGSTIAFLEASGIDLELESRRELLAELLEQYHARYDEDEVLIHSALLKESDLPRAALAFSALMLRIYDLLFATPKRVAKSFLEDLAELIETSFAGKATVERSAPFNEETKDYLVDFMIRRNGHALAVYAGSSEIHALEALLFAGKTAAFKKLATMIVLETPKPQAIKDRTLSRVMNSNLLLATFQNERASLAEKMQNTLSRQLH